MQTERVILENARITREFGINTNIMCYMAIRVQTQNILRYFRFTENLKINCYQIVLLKLIFNSRFIFLTKLL